MEESAGTLFRPTAVKAAGYRWLSPVTVVTPPAAVPAFLVALTAVVMLMLATIVIEIPDRVRVRGVLLPKHGLLKILASRSGWVEALTVDNSDAVETGRVLMWITDVQSAPDSEPESLERIASLKQELHSLERATQQELEGLASRREANLTRRRLAEDRLAAARTEYETLQRQTELQETHARRVAVLAANGQIAAQQAEEIVLRKLQARAEEQSAYRRLLDLQDEIVRLDEQLRDGAQAPELLRARTNMRRESLARDIAAGEVRSAVEVVAPGSGIVAGLVVRTGSYVRAGQVLLTLHDTADPLEARLYVGAENAGMISTGQRVELKLRAYPHQLFGTRTAIVSEISAVALPAREIDASAPVTGTVFEVRATLDKATIVTHGAEWELPPGTELEADLVRYRWPLLQWLLQRTRSTAAADV